MAVGVKAPLPASVILAAADGDEKALNAVLSHYHGYIRFLAMRPLEDITSALEGCLMRREDVAAVLDGFPLNEYFGGISRQELLGTIFSA